MDFDFFLVAPHTAQQMLSTNGSTLRNNAKYLPHIVLPHMEAYQYGPVRYLAGYITAFSTTYPLEGRTSALGTLLNWFRANPDAAQMSANFRNNFEHALRNVSTEGMVSIVDLSSFIQIEPNVSDFWLAELGVEIFYQMRSGMDCPVVSVNSFMEVCRIYQPSL